MSSSRRALASSRVTVDISQALPSWKITRASWNLRPPKLHYSFHSAHPPLIIPEFRPVPSWVGGGDAGASPPPPSGPARSSKQTAAVPRGALGSNGGARESNVVFGFFLRRVCLEPVEWAAHVPEVGGALILQDA